MEPSPDEFLVVRWFGAPATRQYMTPDGGWSAFRAEALVATLAVAEVLCAGLASRQQPGWLPTPYAYHPLPLRLDDFAPGLLVPKDGWVVDKRPRTP